MERPPAPPPEADASDGVLVRRLSDGDNGALEALYDRYVRPAFALARRITGDPVFAEEVVQEVFLALWRDPAKYDPLRGGFPSWLLAATHHKAVDAVRREQTVRSPAGEPGRGGRLLHLRGRAVTCRRSRTPRGPGCAVSGYARRCPRCRRRSGRRSCWRTTPATRNPRSRRAPGRRSAQ